MARKEHTLEYPQEKWGDISLTVTPARHAALGRVTILDPEGVPMPVAMSLALGWTLHGLDQWRLVSEALPTVHLPLQPIPGAGQSTLVLCPAGGPLQALLVHQPTPEEHVLVLGTQGVLKPQNLGTNVRGYFTPQMGGWMG